MNIIKKGSFRFWGDWFGRPLDNSHKPMRSLIEKDMLVVFFEDGEKLTVFNPETIISTDGEFSIADAARIIWEWYPYGEMMAAENKRRIEYIRSSEGKIIKRTNLGDGNEEIINPEGLKAVEMY